MQSTLLSGPTVKTEAEIELEVLQTWKRNRAVIFCNLTTVAYKNHEISYQTAITLITGMLVKLESNFDFKVSQHIRFYVEELNRITPSSAGRIRHNGLPFWIETYSLNFLKIAKSHGFQLLRDVGIGKHSAFNEVANKWNDIGVPITPAQLESWYAKPKKHNLKKNKSKFTKKFK